MRFPGSGYKVSVAYRAEAVRTNGLETVGSRLEGSQDFGSDFGSRVEEDQGAVIGGELCWEILFYRGRFENNILAFGA